MMNNTITVRPIIIAYITGKDGGLSMCVQEKDMAIMDGVTAPIHLPNEIFKESLRDIVTSIIGINSFSMKITDVNAVAAHGQPTALIDLLVFVQGTSVESMHLAHGLKFVSLKDHPHIAGGRIQDMLNILRVDGQWLQHILPAFFKAPDVNRVLECLGRKPLDPGDLMRRLSRSAKRTAKNLKHDGWGGLRPAKGYFFAVGRDCNPADLLIHTDIVRGS